MPKKIVIKKCQDCTFIDDYCGEWSCFHKDAGEYGREIACDTIPVWCPLPDDD